jgi:hypothetical protein
MDAIKTPSTKTNSITRATAGDNQPGSGPLLWQHPHVIGTMVLEDPRGQLFLLFKRYGLSAWARRVTWRCGIDMLLPVDRPQALVLDEFGYSNNDSA